MLKICVHRRSPASLNDPRGGDFGIRRSIRCISLEGRRRLLAYARDEFFTRPEISIGIYVTLFETPIVGEYFAGR